MVRIQSMTHIECGGMTFENGIIEDNVVGGKTTKKNNNVKQPVHNRGGTDDIELCR